MRATDNELSRADPPKLCLLCDSALLIPAEVVLLRAAADGATVGSVSGICPRCRARWPTQRGLADQVLAYFRKNLIGDLTEQQVSDQVGNA